MNRAVAIAGLFAAGVTGLKGQNVTGLSQQERTKVWTVSGSLRGFYDDNSLNSPSGIEEESFGVEFTPMLSLNLPLERTLLRSSYRLALNYYEARTEHNVDQDHEFKLQLNHRFSQRREINVDNTFVYSDSPALNVEEGNLSQTNLRRDSTGIRNYGGVDFSTRFSPTLGATLGYKNNFRDYKETGTNSLSAVSDQIEHLFKIDGNWFPNPNTRAFVGYQFGVLDYTSKDSLGAIVNPADTNTLLNVTPDTRNTHSHYFYVGGNRKFSRLVEGEGSVGVQYTDYYNVGDNDWSPYIDLNISYNYLPGSSARAGLSVQRSSTDSGLSSSGELTLDTLTTAVFGQVQHQITSLLSGSLMGRYQNFTYNGGEFDGQTDDYFTVDLNFQYRIRENLYADAGYLWYRLLSNRENTSFVRNRVYMGVRAVF